MNRMKEERWEPIKGYEDIYLISDCGRVWSIIRNKEKKPSTTSGHLQIQLHRKGSRSFFYIHQLVLQHFGPARPSAAHEVNHKDGVKTNNHIYNLEWVTRSENTKHAFDNGMCRADGVYNGNSKLSYNEVEEIRRQLRNGIKQSLIAEQFGICQSTVSAISTGRNW